MSAKTNDFKIGLFVVIGAAILVGAIILFGASKVFEGKTVEETYVSGTVEGLKVGAPVNLRGVPVGQVSRINFTWNVYRRTEPRYVLVEFTVRNDAWLAPAGQALVHRIEEEVKTGLRARIKSQGLMGSSVVSLEYLDPKDYPPLKLSWQPRHVYIPSAPGQLSEIMAAVSKTADRIKQIDVSALTDSLQADLKAVHQVLDHLNEIDYARIGTNVTDLTAQLRATSEHVRAFIGQPNAAHPPSTLPQLSASTDQVLAEIKAAVARLDTVLANVNTSSLNQILQNMQRASLELDEAVHKFRQYPSGVLFGQPPPPAVSVETPKGH